MPPPARGVDVDVPERAREAHDGARRAGAGPERVGRRPGADRADEVRAVARVDAHGRQRRGPQRRALLLGVDDKLDARDVAVHVDQEARAAGARQLLAAHAAVRPRGARRRRQAEERRAPPGDDAGERDALGAGGRRDDARAALAKHGDGAAVRGGVDGARGQVRVDGLGAEHVAAVDFDKGEFRGHADAAHGALARVGGARGGERQLGRIEVLAAVDEVLVQEGGVLARGQGVPAVQPRVVEPQHVFLWGNGGGCVCGGVFQKFTLRKTNIIKKPNTRKQKNIPAL